MLADFVPDVWGQKRPPVLCHLGNLKILVRMSTDFGTAIHDPKEVSETSGKRSLVRVSSPLVVVVVVAVAVTLLVIVVVSIVAAVVLVEDTDVGAGPAGIVGVEVSQYVSKKASGSMWR